MSNNQEDTSPDLENADAATAPANKHKSEDRGDVKKGLRLIGEYIQDIIRLDEGVDKLATIQEIRNKNSLSGANAWMLMCSIMIASVGLDLNSPAVIIGGMLISPLMSPILGLGLAVGINDRETLRKSIRNFASAIFIAIITSSIYFLLSPFGQVTDEIAARLEPTFLDVVVAIFGGIAGIVSIARKDLSTTLPGVAIATALMPPLCVTGFGIANWDWNITSHSFYLFFLNTVFVALATYVVIRYLRFPLRDYVNAAERSKAFWSIAAFIVLTIVPSFFIFQKVWTRLQNKIKVETFVEDYLYAEKLYIDDYELLATDSLNTLVFKVYGNKIAPSRIPDLERSLQIVGLKDTRIKIISTSEIRLDQIRALESQVDGMRKMAQQLEATTETSKEQNSVIQQLTEQINMARIDSTEYLQIAGEIRSLEPLVDQIVLGQGSFQADGKCIEDSPIVVVSLLESVDEEQQADKEAIQQKVQNYIKIRLQKPMAAVVVL